MIGATTSNGLHHLRDFTTAIVNALMPEAEN
jgi:hypothetical protein